MIFKVNKNPYYGKSKGHNIMSKEDQKNGSVEENIFQKIIEKIIKNQLKYQGRPKDIPISAPDCGWNHGEKIDVDRDGKEDRNYRENNG
jgi:hypothetical protein